MERVPILVSMESLLATEITSGEKRGQGRESLRTPNGLPVQSPESGGRTQGSRRTSGSSDRG